MGDGPGPNFWGKEKSIADGSLAGAKGIQIISQQQHSPKEYTVHGRMSGRFALWRNNAGDLCSGRAWRTRRHAAAARLRHGGGGCYPADMPDPVISALETAVAAPAEHSRRQLEALLEVSEAIAQQRDLPALFHDLAARLHSVVEFDFLTLILHDPITHVMRLHILEP